MTKTTAANHLFKFSEQGTVLPEETAVSPIGGKTDYAYVEDLT